jgi:hypothetical protein
MRKPQSSEEIRWTLYFWAVVIIVGGGTVVGAFFIARAAVRLLSHSFGLPM